MFINDANVVLSSKYRCNVHILTALHLKTVVKTFDKVLELNRTSTIQSSFKNESLTVGKLYSKVVIDCNYGRQGFIFPQK